MTNVVRIPRTEWPSGRDDRSIAVGTRRAFTLPEMVMVLLLISIIAATALPKWTSSLQSYRLSQAATRLVADLTAAQDVAYNSSSSRTITFTASNQYTVAGMTDLNRPTPNYTVTLSDDPYRCTLISVWGNTGTQTLTFNGYGLPDKGGQIQLGCGTLRKTVTVDAATGKAAVQ